MLPEKRRKMLIGFSLIFLVYIAILIYLLAFNTGLEIEGTINPQTGMLNLVVSNNSVHIIREISIFWVDSNGKKHKIEEIAQLMPNAEKQISFNFPKEMKEVTVFAGAPYHQMVERKIGTTYVAPPEFSYTLTGQNIAFVGIGFEINLSVCNKHTETLFVNVKEEHDLNYFEERNQEAAVTIPAMQCGNLYFSLTPKKEGKTKIYFNINAQNSSKKAELEVEIKE